MHLRLTREEIEIVANEVINDLTLCPYRSSVLTVVELDDVDVTVDAHVEADCWVERGTTFMGDTEDVYCEDNVRYVVDAVTATDGDIDYNTDKVLSQIKKIIEDGN